MRDYIFDHIINADFPNPTGSFHDLKKSVINVQHGVQQVINVFRINDYFGSRDESFIGMVVWCAQILCFSKRTLKEMRRPDLEGREPRGQSQLISYNSLSFCLQNPLSHLPGPYNIPKRVHVLTGVGFHSVGPHGGKVCIEFTGVLCFVITFLHVTF